MLGVMDRRWRSCAAGWGVLVLVLLAAPAALAQAGKGDPRRAAAPQLGEQLSALAARQESLEAGLEKLAGELGQLRETLGQLHAAMEKQRDSIAGIQQQDRDMREEVRGLYVETSGLKGDIAQVGQQVNEARQELGSFRFSSGIIAALIVVLQIVVAGLALRGRGG